VSEHEAGEEGLAFMTLIWSNVKDYSERKRSAEDMSLPSTEGEDEEEEE